MQEFICTKKQAKELDGLAFWVAELYNIRELFPNDRRNLDRCDASIRFAMDQLDRLAVPFWAQTPSSTGPKTGTTSAATT